MALKINGIAANNTPFADGEAESLVQRMRRNLEQEMTATSNGQLELAHRYREAAEHLYEQIQARVVKRLERYAWRFFPKEEGLREDVLMEMVIQLRERLLGRLSRSRYFAERFNDAVQMLSIDAFRCIARENDRSIKTGRPEQEILSLNVPLSEDEEIGEDYLAGIIDSESMSAVERIMDWDFARYAMRRLPSDSHRIIYALRTRGDQWQAVALAARVSIRTAQTRFKEAEQRIIEVVGQFNEEREP